MNTIIEIRELEKKIEDFDNSWNYRNSLFEYWMKTEPIKNKINSLKYLNYQKLKKRINEK